MSLAANNKPPAPRSPEALVTRRALATLLGLHPDSLTRNLPAGLGVAVVRWGGRGKETLFSHRMALRWSRARACHRGRHGAPCAICAGVLDDCVTVAQHLRDTRHGHGDCEECDAPWLTDDPCPA